SERAEAQERLMEANRRKDEFLAMLAHELRNPLSPISSAAHLLTIPNVAPALIRQSSQVIARQVGFMTDLIDDLLDVSRVTRGLVVIERHALCVTDFLNGAIEQVKPLLDSRQQQLIVEVAPGLPAVSGDRTRLVQVLANLINNSAKYTPHGGKIEIIVKRDDATVSIQVIDNGMGISPDLLPYVFDLFAQGERTPDRSQGGLGLGLALVKSIVELHAGVVRAASDGPGKGATFEVMLPACATSEAASTGPSPEVGAAPLHALRITLVDDNIDAVVALASVLEAKGHMTTVFHDAHALLATLDHLAPQDVFVLDIGLPEMDGYELVRRLRATSISRPAKIMALTGYGQSHDRAIGKAAGFDDYFVKPLDLAALDQVLSAVVPAAHLRARDGGAVG
ncbi:MAG: hybrid sensor histidine kinase/response regulator, partial [Telluria sp.]